VQDSVTSYNLANDKESTPYGTGYRKQYGAQLSGGTETVRYFLHGEYEDEDGVTKVPEFEKRTMAAKNMVLSPEQQSPNHLTRMTGRANINISLTQQADVSVSTGYITSDLRLPRSDDSGVSGIAANTYGGPGFKYNRTTAGDTLYSGVPWIGRRVIDPVVDAPYAYCGVNRPSKVLHQRGGVLAP